MLLLLLLLPAVSMLSAPAASPEGASASMLLRLVRCGPVQAQRIVSFAFDSCS
jgi:hypothetical protein